MDEIKVKIGTSLMEVERDVILATLNKYKNPKTTSQVLGITTKTLYNKLKLYKLINKV